MGKKKTHFIIISRVSNVTGGAITLNFLLFYPGLLFFFIANAFTILEFYSHRNISFSFRIPCCSLYSICFMYTLFFIFINFCQQWNILQIFININQFLCVEIEFMTFWVLNWVIPRPQPLPLNLILFVLPVVKEFLLKYVRNISCSWQKETGSNQSVGRI